MRDPVELLVSLSESLAGGCLPDREAAEWFVAGARRAVTRDERLDSALGLSGAGKRGLQASVGKLLRDMHLAAAAQGIVLDPLATLWDRAVRLSEEVEPFMDQTWPVVRRLSTPPTDWAPWRVHLFHAARTDVEIPRAARHLYRLLTPTPAFTRQSGTAEHLRHLLLLGDDANPDDLRPDRA